MKYTVFGSWIGEYCGGPHPVEAENAKEAVLRVMLENKGKVEKLSEVIEKFQIVGIIQGWPEVIDSRDMYSIEDAIRDCDSDYLPTMIGLDPELDAAIEERIKDEAQGTHSHS